MLIIRCCSQPKPSLMYPEASYLIWSAACPCCHQPDQSMHAASMPQVQPATYSLSRRCIRIGRNGTCIRAAQAKMQNRFAVPAACQVLAWAADFNVWLMLLPNALEQLSVAFLLICYAQHPDLRALAGGCSVRVIPEDCCGWGADGRGNRVARSVNTCT